MVTTTPTQPTILAKKVIGTKVVNVTGDDIGKIEDVVLDKSSNSIMFAVVGFDGFFGINEKFHPVPWSSLNYDRRLQSYVVPYTMEQLREAPVGTIEELTGDLGEEFRDRSYKYYDVPRDWGG